MLTFAPPMAAAQNIFGAPPINSARAKIILTNLTSPQIYFQGNTVLWLVRFPVTIRFEDVTITSDKFDFSGWDQSINNFSDPPFVFGSWSSPVQVVGPAWFEGRPLHSVSSPAIGDTGTATGAFAISVACKKGWLAGPVSFYTVRLGLGNVALTIAGVGGALDSFSFLGGALFNFSETWLANAGSRFNYPDWGWDSSTWIPLVPQTYFIFPGGQLQLLGPTA